MEILLSERNRLTQIHDMPRVGESDRRKVTPSQGEDVRHLTDGLTGFEKRDSGHRWRQSARAERPIAARRSVSAIARYPNSRPCPGMSQARALGMKPSLTPVVS